jgi:hypothetical protein
MGPRGAAPPRAPRCGAASKWIASADDHAGEPLLDRRRAAPNPMPCDIRSDAHLRGGRCFDCDPGGADRGTGGATREFWSGMPTAERIPRVGVRRDR